MGSRSRNEKETTLKKGPWTKEEDQKLLSYIQEHAGHGSWRSLPEKAGLQRCGKSCRLRWTNYLRPDIKRGKFSTYEEKTIIRLHALLGNRWSSIAAYLPNRTDNEIKNYWNTRLKKRLTRMGIDPATHKPKNNPSAPNLAHMAQWETARLEAEARLSLLHGFKPSSVTATTNTSHNNYYNSNATQPARPCLDVLKVWQATSFSAKCLFDDSTRLLSSVSDGGVGLVEYSDSTQTNMGKIENSSSMHGLDREHHQLYGYGYNVAANCDNGYYDDNSMMMMNRADQDHVLMGDYEESKRYWNELFNMVISSSPML